MSTGVPVVAHRDWGWAVRGSSQRGSQPALPLDAIPGGVDAARPCRWRAYELRRHAARRPGCPGGFPASAASRPRAISCVAGRSRETPSTAYGSGCIRRRPAARRAAARAVPGHLVQPEAAGARGAGNPARARSPARRRGRWRTAPQHLLQHAVIVGEGLAKLGRVGLEPVRAVARLVEQPADVAHRFGGMRNCRLKASISARFTGPSHLASLADSTTTAMENNWSRRPSMAATRAGLKALVWMPNENRRSSARPPVSAAWPSAAPTTAPNGPPMANPAMPPMTLPQYPIAEF